VKKLTRWFYKELRNGKAIIQSISNGSKAV
jgi:hypothetical protein